MTVFSARVVNGKLEIPEGALPEGITVTVIVPDGDDAGFTVTEAEKAFLLESIAQAERGEVVDGWELLRKLES